MQPRADDVLTIIPARKGSRGLPGKNSRPLLGHPLVSWTISQALSDPQCGLVHVSTDCNAVADVAKSLGADVPYSRPERLATDTSTTMSVIDYALDHYRSKGHEFSFVVLAEPTSPIRKPGDFGRAVSRLRASDGRFESLVTVARAMNHPAHAKRIVDGRLVPVTSVEDAWARRQDLPDVYAPYTVAFVAHVEALLDSQTFYGQRCMPLVLDRFQAYEVDDEYDFACVEAVMELALKRGYVDPI